MEDSVMFLEQLVEQLAAGLAQAGQPDIFGQMLGQQFSKRFVCKQVFWLGSSQ